MKKGDWVTNHPVSIKGWWPRRTAKYKEGRPKPTLDFSVEDFESKGYIGIYLDEEVESYYSLPLVKNPKELKEFQK